MKKILISSFIALVCTLGISPLALAAPLKVVSSFSILADLVTQIGGEKVDSVAIVGPEGDAHSFEPRPSDAKFLLGADLVIVNGLGFEVWLAKLAQAADYKGQIIEAIKGVPLRPYVESHAGEAEPHDDDHNHGEYDPHAWQSLVHIQRYIQNIRQALVDLDPDNKAYYDQRTQDYLKQINDLHQRLLVEFSRLTDSQRTVVSSHDAFGYLGQAYGIEFISLLGASNQAEPSAKELAALIAYMREHQVQAIFMENISSPKLLEQIARETDAVIGKTLYSDALAKPPHVADTYLGMMRWNTTALLEALTAK